MATPTMPAMPQLPAAQRVTEACRRRDESDYVCEFWTAFGWTVLTLGVFGYYIFYQLMRRDRDHMRRRLDVLEAATENAWEVAGRSGLQDELRPKFERLSAQTGDLRKMSTEFRDPAIWLVLTILTGIAEIIGWIFLDQDLTRHSGLERTAQAELTTIYARLGFELPDGPISVKGAHNYVGRIVASVFTVGIYSLWWWADIMREGNDHFAENWQWEDNLARVVTSTTGEAGAA